MLVLAGGAACWVLVVEGTVALTPCMVESRLQSRELAFFGPVFLKFCFPRNHCAKYKDAATFQ